jgi:Bacterial SH3 domain
MMMKKILQIISVLLFMLIVSCVPNAGLTNPVTGPGAWIDAPLDGSTIPLAPYGVVSHASDPGGISTFELKVNGQLVSTDSIANDQAGQTIAHISQPWLPPAPGTYLLEVRAANGDGDYGPSVFAQVKVGDVTTAETSTPTPSPDVQVCAWTAKVNVFVREGPGASIYPQITAVEAGKMFTVVGQSQDDKFWAVEVQKGLIGYVSKSDRFGGVTGGCNVPTLTDPVPPPATTVPAPEEPKATTPQCSDGVDNDRDGKIDFNRAPGVGDRECTSADDNDEANR